MCDTVDETPNDLTKLKVADLKKELKSRGLSTAGNKSELIERLQEILPKDNLDLSDHPDILADSVLLDEDVLNDDVLDEKDENKLIGLKRTHSMIECETNEDNIQIEKNSVISSDMPFKKEQKQIIKLSSFSDKERLEMRAKKFGTPLTTEMKKEVRAARFGLNTNAKSKDISEGATLEILKKRAERFGSCVSKTLTEAEAKDKLEKRKERFKLSQNNSCITSTAQAKLNSMTNSEKAQMRLKRFNVGQII